MYLTFDVSLNFRDRIYGGLPKDKQVLENYVKAKFKSEDTSPADTDLDLEESLDQYTNGFRCDDTGIYLGSYQIKAMLSEAASLLEITTKKRGSKQTIKEGLIIKGRDLNGGFTGEKVYLLPYKSEPDGIETVAGHVSTAQGSRDILRNMEYVVQPNIKFQLWFLLNRFGEDERAKKITVLDVKKMLAHGRELGLGSFRNHASGKFDIASFEQLETPKDEDIIDF